jgi:transposase
MGSHDLTDAQWCQLAPLLPPQKLRIGRPGRPHRRLLNGILWILAIGAPCRDLPTQYGSWHTVSSRFYRWRHAGIWARLLQGLQRQADRQGQVDWSVHFLNSNFVRAHQHAAGARGRHAGQAGEALGCSRGGFSTKRHVRADRHGKPVVLLVTAGERYDQTMFEPLLERCQIRQQGRGRPRKRPGPIVGGKRFSSWADPGLAALAWHPTHPRAQTQRVSARSVRSHAVSRAQSGGAAHQSPQTVPPRRHAVREAHHKLPRDGDPGRPCYGCDAASAPARPPSACTM